jgi:hypothetical protein
MRFSLFWDVTQRRLVVTYRRFGTTFFKGQAVLTNYQSILLPLRLKRSLEDYGFQQVGLCSKQWVLIGQRIIKTYHVFHFLAKQRVLIYLNAFYRLMKKRVRAWKITSQDSLIGNLILTLGISYHISRPELLFWKCSPFFWSNKLECNSDIKREETNGSESLSTLALRCLQAWS